MRCANRKFTHGSVERHVALRVGRQNAVLAVGRNAPVPGKDRLALQRASRKFTRGSVGGMWPAAFAWHDAMLAAGRDALVPGIRLCRGNADWPCGVQTVSSRTAQWSGMWPAAFARHDAVLAAVRNALVPGIQLCREWACPGAVSYTHLDVYKRQNVGRPLITQAKRPKRGPSVHNAVQLIQATVVRRTSPALSRRRRPGAVLLRSRCL